MFSRPRTALQIGCYLAVLSALLHMVGYVLGFQSENDTERQLLDQFSRYNFQLPGASRSLMDLMDGFSLIFALFFATTAGLGLIVARRGAADAVLTTAVVRTLAAAYLVALVISLTKFFIIPTTCFAAVALCFVIASVGRQPD